MLQGQYLPLTSTWQDLSLSNMWHVTLGTSKWLITYVFPIFVGTFEDLKSKFYKPTWFSFRDAYFTTKTVISTHPICQSPCFLYVTTLNAKVQVPLSWKSLASIGHLKRGIPSHHEQNCINLIKFDKCRTILQCCSRFQFKANKLGRTKSWQFSKE